MCSAFAVFMVSHQFFLNFALVTSKFTFQHLPLLNSHVFAVIELTRIDAFWCACWSMVLNSVQLAYIYIGDGDGKFHMFPFFKIIQENNSLRKSYEDYFIDKFKPLLNKKT